ncbi:uncharacterized protein LOC121069091 isoform X1 [Cygnus olor]|uniref:uncharacterized protein LOC121069091 isoform X1 n=1 Tax=Cygnus olor TaxID=8869 RepID=UPI001ADEBC5D|nr:uncharacterized protein LOC121069091 isoform X1 [Cygnus olor]
MYSPGEGRDESAFNLPAINFNRIPGCCTAWTPRLFSASPSPLSPISTTVCFARAFSNVFTCNLSLNVQCLSCSGVLRPSQWIGSSFGAEGRQTAWEMGPTCAAWWIAAPLLVHVPWQPGGGRGRAGRVPPPRPSPHPASSCGEGRRGESPPPPLPPPRHGGQGARGCLGGGRTESSCFGRRRFRPLGEICCAVQPPLPAAPPSPRCTQALLSHYPAFALLIWRDQVGSGITNVIGCYK